VAELPRQRRDEAARLGGGIERQQLVEHALDLGAAAQHDRAQALGILRERGADRGGLEEQVDALLSGTEDVLGVQSLPPTAPRDVHTAPSAGTAAQLTVANLPPCCCAPKDSSASSEPAACSRT